MLQEILSAEKIEYFGVLPFSACECRRPDIISRRGVSPDDVKSAVMLLVPYYVGDGEGNVSFYARSGDYHVFCEEMFSRVVPKLEKAYGGRFLGFADKSPVRENVAASMAGLGMLGDNYMLISETYGTFVFVAELLSTVAPERLGFSGKVAEPRACPHCGACKLACPMTDGLDCLSAVTQKKGTLSTEEEAYLRRHGYAWGCDICQLACPFTRAAIAAGVETPIDFFRKDRISTLTTERLAAMDDEAFERRAFSWRGREVLARNLKILEK